MTRIDVINNLIKNNGYTKYLEIGVQNGESFFNVYCEYKVGVDPDPKSKATHIMTSDEFFEQNKEAFDVIFIDGLHTFQQCRVDILHSVLALNKKGTIVVHDLLPTSKEMQEVPRKTKIWTGDVWKAWAFLYGLQATTYMMEVYDFDYGVGCIRPDRSYNFSAYDGWLEYSIEYRYAFGSIEYRNRLMNVVEYENRKIL